MITIFAADLSHGDPAVDTVTCMETPSTVAGYAGPPSLTISVAALWLAMRQFITEAPADPVNLISWTDQGVAARSATASRTVRRWYGCWSSR